MSVSFEFKTASGGQPDTLILKIMEGITIRKSDRLAIGAYLKEQIIDRTYAGIDCHGVAFTPYSKKGPYYYYPSPGGTLKQRKAAVNRLLRITSEVAGNKYEHLLRHGTDEQAERASVGGVRTRSGVGIRFESYSDFKSSLGRAGVDLTGPRAPHMMQTLTVRDVPESEGVAIGIYDAQKAAIARGHQFGTRHLPKRAFLGATEADIEQCVRILNELLRGRIRQG